ncbi:hypothetical protein B0J17DRAFT_717043 [Rhizoctonia solani]|nr:hypothetical protein B0J17DRAFT_717043 [Rhizoctonia solani]
MRSSAHRKVAQGHIRGAFISWLRQSTNTAELDVTYQFVDKELLDIENKFTIQKQRWTHSHDTEQKDELEAMRKRVRALEEQLNTRPDPYLH